MPGWIAHTGRVILVMVTYVVMFAGVLIIPFGIPGQFVVVAAAGVLALAGGGLISWWVVLGLLALAVLAEVLEGMAGFVGAGRAKGSFWSAVGAVAGGLVGAVLGSFVLPIVGSLIGAFVGTFAGAFLVEYGRTRRARPSGHVARGALIGRVVGSLTKVFIGLAMIAIVTAALIW